MTAGELVGVLRDRLTQKRSYSIRAPSESATRGRITSLAKTLTLILDDCEDDMTVMELREIARSVVDGEGHNDE